MLGKLYALCLCKYVRMLLLHRGRVRWPRHVYPVKTMISAHEYYFTVAFSSIIAHNYKYTDDSRFTRHLITESIQVNLFSDRDPGQVAARTAVRRVRIAAREVWRR